MVDRSKLGKQSKEKGKRYERKVANAFKAAGFLARRSVQYKGTATSQDVEAETPIPLNIEAKYVAKLNIRKAYQRTVEDGDPNAISVVVHGMANKIDLVTLSFSDFLKLLQKIKQEIV